MRGRWLQLATGERGALLWLPALGAACWLLLFALRVAPSAGQMFTRTTSLRIAVAPWRGNADAAPAVDALRTGLATHGDLSVVDASHVDARLASVAGRDDSTLVRALRPLNAHWTVTGDLVHDGDRYLGELRAFDAHRGRLVVRLRSEAASAAAVGAALAESLHAAAFEPQPFTAALR
jgi:hypothetical protein